MPIGLCAGGLLRGGLGPSTSMAGGGLLGTGYTSILYSLSKLKLRV
ncbi:hypothetical protein FFONT_0677 [Fervidicoccus fontis Kam940]|uniref:Uncharacterized protein n=1 Tax=Fervidicoccus fontis (strain DSM 19380 / JCM 18336 / VKM B-2539 / Kam940) TaxID=1163730 RepID=I0A108_FERFK|nr:hypothetical protein [Fervidicoccus fontis]AFH42665.1 hypothetical protein FFONT_0677 [Fervidicoccus fontis Kam940]